MLTRDTKPGDVVWTAHATLSDFRYAPSIQVIRYVMVVPQHLLANLLADDNRVIKDSPSLISDTCYRTEREAMQAALELFNGLINNCIALAAAYEVSIADAA